MDAAILFADAATERFRNCLHAQYRGRPHLRRDVNQWWKSLRDEPAVRFFGKQRNVLAHEKPLPVGQNIFAGWVAADGSWGNGYAPTRAADFYSFEAGTPADVTVREQLDSLKAILAVAAMQF